MEIAIIDDSSLDRAILRNLAKKFFEDRKNIYGICPQFSEFESGEAFLKNYTVGKYRIIFLDIYMNELTGMDVAKRVFALDKECSIIFSTTSDDHQLEGYSVHAVGYVIKPISSNINSLYNSMEYVASRLQLDIAGINVHSCFGELHIYFKNVIYIDCLDRTVYIHLVDGDIKLLGRYSDYEGIFLADQRFLECYRNIIVNMDYIDIPLDYDFILKSGEKLPISRRKKANVLARYMTYFIRKRG